jgi:hypothetical protein
MHRNSSFRPSSIFFWSAIALTLIWLPIAFAEEHLTSAGPSASEIKKLMMKERFGWQWGLPEELATSRIEKLLQTFVTRTYGKAFRYIGETEDFDHGHVLFTADKLTEQQRLRPFAILYHTQENAYAARWKGTVAPRFDYLDPTTRNWLQWLTPNEPGLDGEIIVNAREFMSERESKALFFNEVEPVEGQHYTVHGFQIDQQRVGFGVLGEIQLNFKGIECRQDVDVSATERIISVDVLGHGRVCLKLSASSHFVEYEGFRTQARIRNR